MSTMYQYVSFEWASKDKVQACWYSNPMRGFMRVSRLFAERPQDNPPSLHDDLRGHGSLWLYVRESLQSERGAMGGIPMPSRKFMNELLTFMSSGEDSPTCFIPLGPAAQPMIQAIGRTAHEINRTYCQVIGFPAHPKWDKCELVHQQSICQGVGAALRGSSPRQNHESWMRAKLEDGWEYGPVKNIAAKTHDQLVPYDQLKPEQLVQGELFYTAVRETFKTLVGVC